MTLRSPFTACCLLLFAAGCEPVDPDDPSGDDPDTSSEEGLPTEATIFLSEDGSPDPSTVSVVVDGAVTFDNTESTQEAQIDFSSDLPSAPQDVTIAAGSTGTVSPAGGGEWSYTNRSAGAGVPASGTIISDYND